eukprot:1294538-Ditylum_brightwellii.AAC.1
MIDGVTTKNERHRKRRRKVYGNFAVVFQTNIPKQRLRMARVPCSGFETLKHITQTTPEDGSGVL